MIKPKPGYKLVKSLFRKYEEIPEEWVYETIESKKSYLQTLKRGLMQKVLTGQIRVIA